MNPIKVTVALATAPLTVTEQHLLIAHGALVADALAASDAVASFAPEFRATLTVSIWGKTVRQDAVLSDGDRIEVVRPLRVDPKVARRERFAKQGSKGAGLFAKTRAGGKAGY